MYCASSFTPNGAGESFLSVSIAFSAMAFFGPSFAGKSNSSTGTRALMRCAAICAPITPAPSTATLRILRLLTLFLQRICNVERIWDFLRRGTAGCCSCRGAASGHSVFQRRARSRASKRRAQRERLEQRFVDFHQRLRTRARLADRRGRFGQQLREVEARGGQLRLVERIARAFLVERDARHARPE